MRIRLIVLTLLGALTGALAKTGKGPKDLSSTEVEKNKDLQELFLGEDLLDGQFQFDQDFRRKKKPGRKPKKKPGKKPGGKSKKKPDMRPFRSFRSTALTNSDSKITDLTCSTLEDFQTLQEGCGISTFLPCLFAGYKTWTKCKAKCDGEIICTLNCVRKKILQNSDCSKCTKKLMQALCCHFIGGECCSNTNVEGTGSICCHIADEDIITTPLDWPFCDVGQQGCSVDSPCLLHEEKCCETWPPKSPYLGCCYKDTEECPLIVKETNSDLVVSENEGSVAQTNTFNPWSGLLTIDVPSHISDIQQNFTESTSIFQSTTNTNIVKSNSSCVLSDIPEYINVTGIPQFFEDLANKKVVWDNEKKTVVYDVKMIKSVIGHEERNKLNPSLNNLCNNEVIKKTETKKISKDNYEKLINGEIVFLNETVQDTRNTGCQAFSSCTKRGPQSCGNFGWYNPALGKNITMHQVSAGTQCLTCCWDLGGICDCAEQFPDLCPCGIITSKEIFEDCRFKKRNYDVTYQDSGTSRSVGTQLLTYNSETDARSIKIHVPSHGNVEETTVVMHAHTSGPWHDDKLSNNMMMKLGSTCHVQKMPSHIFPIDIATGLKEIHDGNFILTPDDEKKQYSIVRNGRLLTSTEENALHSDIKDVCKDSVLANYQETDVNETEFETLNNGGIIVLGSNNGQTRGCSIQTKATSKNNTSHCWRWPNPGTGKEISVHGLVRSVIEVTCCKELEGAYPVDCCKTSTYCNCDYIVDKTTFERCMVPVTTVLDIEDSDDLIQETFLYNRTEGYLVINVEGNQDETTVVLSEEQDHMILKSNHSCHLLPLDPKDPLEVALNAEEVVKKLNGPLTPDMQTTSWSVLVSQLGQIPPLPDYMQICDGLSVTLANEVQIDEAQYEDLNAGIVITLSEQSLPSPQNSGEFEQCLLQTKCASSNGTSSVWWPNSNKNPPYANQEVISSPTCLSCCAEGYNPKHCNCDQVTDLVTFQQCLERKEMVVAMGGFYDGSQYDVVNKFIRNESSPTLKLESLPLDPNSNFPVKTSGSVGVWIDNHLIACQGNGGVKNGCYEMNLQTKSWTQGGDYAYLADPLKYGGASAKYKSGPNGTEPGETWWVIGGDHDGVTTQEWNSVEGVNPWDPPVLPLKMNTPSMVAISERQIFVTTIPMFQPIDTNLAWIFSRDFEENEGWKTLPPLLEKRISPACGFLPNDRLGWIVVAGGYGKGSTEILDVSNCFETGPQECTWEYGPDLEYFPFADSMVTLSTGDLVLLGDNSNILAINSTFANWEVVGKMSQPRNSLMVLAIESFVV